MCTTIKIRSIFMKKKKLSVFLLAGIMAAGGLALASCKPITEDDLDSHDSSSGEHSEEISSSEHDSSDSSSSEQNQHEHHFSTEWVKSADGHYHVCTDEGCNEKKDVAPHTYVTKKNTVDSSCDTQGYTSEVKECSVCGYVASEVKKDFQNAKSHSFTVEVEKVAPTCTTPGYTLYKCATCDATYKDIIKATGHDWDKEPTCTEGASCKNCNAILPPNGHHYHEDTSARKASTCTEQGEHKFVCEDCGDYYVTKEQELGHDFGNSQFVFDHREAVQDKECTYKLVYRNHCLTCDEDIYIQDENETVQHNLITKYVTYPTCQSVGEKGNYCTECGKFIGEKAEVPVNPNAHDWDEGTTVAGVTTFHCKNAGCTATKTSIVAGGNELNSIAKDDFTAVQELKLDHASLEFDDDSKAGFTASNISLTVDKLDPEDLGLNDDQLDKLQGNSVYDFNLFDGDTDEKVEFNEVTVRIPYELNDDDDPEALTVYYIDDDGQLHDVTATYENGFAVFKTTHFSLYCVTFMSPAERCALFGHIYGDPVTINKTCLTDGFTYQYCSRCHHIEYTDYQKATGHTYQVNETGSNQPTCTEAGHTDYLCSECGATYGYDLPALGHNYVFDKDHSKDATCTEAGHYRYVCDRDGCTDATANHTKTITIAAKGHNYVAKTVAPTCEKEGSTTYICEYCGDEDTSRKVTLPKVDHKYVYKSENSSQYIYECEYCHAENKVAKGGKALIASYAKENDFFTNSVKSLENFAISASGELAVEAYNNNEKVFSFDATDAKAFVGLDDNNMPTMSASVNYNDEVYAIYYSNGKLYLVREVPNGYHGYTVYNYDNQYVYGNNSNITASDVINNIPNIMNFFNNEVVPYIDQVVDANDGKVNEVMFNAVNSLFTASATSDGFVIRLDQTKFNTLADKVKNGTIKEVFEYIFGEDTLNPFLDRIGEYSNVSLYRALEMLKEDTGIDYKELLALIDKGVKEFSDYDSLRDLIYESSNHNVDINEYLSENYLKNHSIVGLVKENQSAARFFGNETKASYIEKTIKG